MAEQLLYRHQPDLETTDGFVEYHHQDVGGSVHYEWAFDSDEPTSPMTPTWITGTNPVTGLWAASLTDMPFTADNYVLAEHLSHHDGTWSGNPVFTTYDNHTSCTLGKATPAPHAHLPYSYSPAYLETCTSPASVPNNLAQTTNPNDTSMSVSANAMSAATYETADARDTNQCSSNTFHTHTCSRYAHRHWPSISTSSDGNVSEPEGTDAPSLRQRRFRNKHIQVERKYRDRLNGHFERLLSVLPADRFRSNYGLGGEKAFSKTITRCEVLEIAMKMITESQAERVA